MISFLQRYRTQLTLLLVLMTAVYFRVGVGFFWDEDQHLHPDERFLTMVTERIQFPPSVSGYFDTSTSTLSPYNKDFGFFVYGTLPIFITKVFGKVTALENYWQIHYVGRVMAAAFDVATIMLLYAFGSALFSPAVGVFAAIMLALSPSNVQLSHFFGVENPTSFFVLLALFLAYGFDRSVYIPYSRSVNVRRVERLILLVCLIAAIIYWWLNKLPLYAGLTTVIGLYLVWRVSNSVGRFGYIGRSLWLAVALGCAIASKISAIYLLPALFIIFSKRLIEDLKASSAGKKILTPLALGGLKYLITGLFIAGIGFITFRVFQPYAFSGLFSFNPKFLANMNEVQGLMKGGDIPPSIQWVSRTPVLYSLYNMFWWFMGISFFISAIGGLLLVLTRIIVDKQYQHVAWLFFLVFWFGIQSTQFVKAGRYLSMIYPLLALCSAVFLVWLVTISRKLVAAHKGVSQHQGYEEWIPSAAFVVGALIWTIAVTNIYRSMHTRLEASRWIYANIPCGATFANEHWDDALPVPIDGKDSYGYCYKGVEFENYNWDNQEKLKKLMDGLKSTQYVLLTSGRLYMHIPRLSRRFPFTSEYYRMLFSGELGFKLIKVFKSYPRVLGMEFNDDSIEETATVYDHPKVLIFQKTASFDADYIFSKLSKFPDALVEPLTAGP